MAYEKRPRMEEAIIAGHARKKGVDAPSSEPAKDGKVRCEYVLSGNHGDDNNVMARYKRMGYEVVPDKLGYAVTFVAPVETVRANQQAAEDLHYRYLNKSKEIGEGDKEILTATLLEGEDAPPGPEEFLKGP